MPKTVDHNGDHNHHETASPPILSSFALRAKVIMEILVDRGVLTPEQISDMRRRRAALTSNNGARLIARSWIDDNFRNRLLSKPISACGELGISVRDSFQLVVVQNTRTVRHLVVCTLCSCYPVPILGRPPDWYKSFAYRSRAVRDPRGVLREFGVAVPDECQVQVHDSTADIRYLVVPQRPLLTDGWQEEDLARLVTRDSMIGAGDPIEPTAPQV